MTSLEKRYNARFDQVPNSFTKVLINVISEVFIYYPPIFTLDLPYMHEYITRSLHCIFNHRKDIVYRRSSSILIFVIRMSYCKITFYECPFNIQRRLGLGVAYVTTLLKVSGSSLGKLFYLRFFYLKQKKKTGTKSTRE